MFAIAFDLNINDLRSNYNDPYNNAYYEIKTLLRRYDFYNTQGSVYLTEKNDMSVLFSAIVTILYRHLQRTFIKMTFSNKEKKSYHRKNVWFNIL